MMERQKPLTKKQKYILWAVDALLLILIIYPIFLGGLIGGYDPGFHMARIRTLASNIASGHFPNPIGFEYLHHLGYGVGFFYGNFLLYPFALIRLMGLSLYHTYILYIVIFVGLNIFSINFVTDSLFHNWWATLVSGPLYLSSYYFITVIYTRAAIGELTAFAIIPLVILSLFKMFEGEVKYWWLLFISLALLLVSHILSFLIVLGAIILIVLMNIKAMIKNHQIFWSFCKSAIAFLGITAVFLLPFLQQYATQKYLSTATDRFGNYLVLVYASGMDNKYFDPEQFISMNGSLIVALLIFAVGYYIFKEKGLIFHNKIIAQSLVVIILFGSFLVSYSWVKFAVSIFKPFVLLQVMSRVDVVVLPLITLVVASALGELLSKAGNFKLPLTTVFLAVVAMITVVFPIKENLQNVSTRAQDIYTLSVSMGEYEPRDFECYNASQDYQVTPKKLAKSQGYSIISDNHHEAEVAFEKARPGQVVMLPRLNYRGYQVEFSYNGKIVKQAAISKNGLVAAKLPSDFHRGVIKVNYKMTKSAIAGWIISSVSLILLILAKIRIPVYKHSHYQSALIKKHTPFYRK